MPRLKSVCLSLFPFALMTLWTAFFFDKSVHLVRSLVFGLSLVLLILHRDTIKFSPYRPTLVAFLTFGAVALASTLVNASGLNGVRLFADWCVLLFSGAVAAALIGDKLFTSFLTLSILLSAGFWIVQAVGVVDPTLIVPFYHDEKRLKLFTHNSSVLSMIVGACALFVLHSLTRAKARLAKAGYILLTISLLALLYATNGRGSMLALAAALPLALAFVYRRAAVAALLAVCIAASLFLAYKFLPDNERIDRIRAGIAHMTEDGTFKERRKIWEVSWWAIKDKPLLGHGLRSSPDVYDTYQPEHADELRSQGFTLVEDIHHHAHNLALYLLTETGALGAATFFIFYFLLLLQARRIGGFGLFYASFLTFYFIWCLFESGIHRKLDSILLFLFAGPFMFPSVRSHTE